MKLKETEIPLAGAEEDTRAAIKRGADAVAEALAKRFPASDGYAIRWPDRQAAVAQQGKELARIAKVRRGRFSLHVGIVAHSAKQIRLITQSDSVIPPFLIYVLMFGGAGAAAFLASQGDGVPTKGLVVAGLVGMIAGGGVALGLDKLFSSSVSPDQLTEIHEHLLAEMERGLKGA